MLSQAGHGVTLITTGPADALGSVRVDVPTNSVLQAIRYRLLPDTQRAKRLTRLLTEAAARTRSDVYIPTDSRALASAIAAAEQTDGQVGRTPKMDDAGRRDLIRTAPGHPEAASPVAGMGVFHTPDDDRSRYTPTPGRHSGKSVVLCYRKSEVNPGRYLEAALRRAGVDLEVETDGINLSSVDPDMDLVLFVEGPYPALEVNGSTSVTTLFWAHHGEHHLHANIRLADRYRADAVLLAHSWHLAFWFPTPVHRFPFGIAPDLLDPSKKLPERTYDVAMVGAGLTSGAQYGRRQELVAALQASIPGERLGFREKVSAGEMARLYGDSRIVINEGGTRHFPITMRVFEAVGSGAVLLSDRLPGMEMILERDKQFAELGPDVATSVDRILSDLDAAQDVADSALESASGLHTYDHRVDELFQIAESTSKRSIESTEPKSALGRAISKDVEVQRVGQWGAIQLQSELPSREVWDTKTLERSRLAPGKMESVAISANGISDLDWLLRSARRFAYLEGEYPNLDSILESDAPQASKRTDNGVTRVDFKAPSYRVMDYEGLNS